MRVGAGTNAVSWTASGCVVAFAVIVAGAACSSTKPSAPAASSRPKAPSSAATDPGGPGLSGVTHHTSPASQALGQKLLKSALEAMGGAAAVDQVRSLELRGSLEEAESGGSVRAALVERIVFPDRYRRDVTLASATISTLLTPDGGFLIGGGQTRRFPHDETDRLEKEVMRNPVALLKTRRDQT